MLLQQETIVLASASPRRKELLEQIGCTPLIRPCHAPEDRGGLTDPKELVTALAVQKARGIERKPHELIIAADTVVCKDGVILGKPADRADADRMLTLLSGTEHRVFTGFCLLKGDRMCCGAEETTVLFRPLTSEIRQWYLDTGEPFDKAGAYGIQGKGCLLIERICGDYNNVVGLPLSRICAEYRAWEGTP